MTSERDIERILDQWFNERPTHVADRVLDGVADRIARERQRPARRLLRREPMSINARMAAAIAAVAIISSLTVGVLTQVAREPVVSQPPSTASQPPATASPIPSASASPLSENGLVVFEHNWPLGAAPHTRLEYLLPDLRGQVLLPGFEYEQSDPVWSADGGVLAFSARNPAADGEGERIWQTNAKGVEPELLSIDCQAPDCLEETDPAYSADSEWLVFVRLTGMPGELPESSVVAMRDLRSGEVTLLETTRRSFQREDGGFEVVSHPRLSPDGTRLVFHVHVRDADDQPVDSHLFIADADGSDPRRLAPDLPAGDAEWSPDGSLIVFSTKPIHEWPCCAWDQVHVYRISPDGSGLGQLGGGASTGSPSWADGGRQVLYVEGVENATASAQDIKVMTPDGLSTRLVAPFSDCCRWYPVQQPTP